jgi:hypothetical protein
MNSESKSSGLKGDSRQPPKARNASKPPTGDSSGAPADRPPRRRDNNEHRERPERQDRPERAERGERPERQERPVRARRPQTGPAANSDKSKSAAEEKTHRPMVYVKGDIASGSTWAKGRNGPSFADMVRQSTSAATVKSSAKNTPPPAKQNPPPPAQQQQQQQPPQEPQQEEEQQQQPPQQQQHQRQQTPPQPAQQAPPAQPEESSEEEDVVVMSAVQAPPVVVMEAMPEPLMAEPLVIPPHYVLEIERVVSVKLPSRVMQTAEAQRGAYMFSAQAGKPPTPPPTVQQHAVYRPDTANLGARQWSLGTDSRIQQPALPQQQQGWPGAGQMDYWNNTGDRAPVSRPFMGSQPQTQYNSYPTTMPLSHQRPTSNAFPMRFRSSEVPESVLRQQPQAPFNRAPQSTNGGGVW